MMNMSKKLKWIFVFLLVGSVVGCSSTNQHRSIGQVIDDSVISNKLKTRLLKDGRVRGFGINVDTRRGVVTLRGKVKRQSQIDRAIEIAERQPGVKEVKSYLVIKDSGKSAPVEEKDITKKQSGKKPVLNPEADKRNDLDKKPASVTGY